MTLSLPVQSQSVVLNGMVTPPSGSGSPSLHPSFGSQTFVINPTGQHSSPTGHPLMTSLSPHLGGILPIRCEWLWYTLYLINTPLVYRKTEGSILYSFIHEKFILWYMIYTAGHIFDVACYMVFLHWILVYFLYCKSTYMIVSVCITCTCFLEIKFLWTKLRKINLSFHLPSMQPPSYSPPPLA